MLRALKKLFWMSILTNLISCVGLSDQLGELSNHDNSAFFCPGNRNEEGLCLGTGNDEKWDFSKASDYSYNENFIEISSGGVALKEIDTNFSGSDFKSGDHVGTFIENNKLQMKTKATNNETHVNSILPDKSSNLIGYWRFDNNLLDSSSLANNGTLNTGVISFESHDYISGLSSLSFDGATSIILNSPVTISKDNGAISLWFKSNSIQAGNYFDHAHFLSNGGIARNYIGIEGTKLRAEGTLNNEHWVNVNNSQSKIGQWFHYVITTNSGVSKAFLNGVQMDSKSITTDMVIQYFSNPDTTSGGAEYDGLIDEVAIWNESLSETDIEMLYERQNKNYSKLSKDWTPYWDDIVGYWEMDGNWQDSSGKGNHGAAQNGTTFSNVRQVGSHSGQFDGVDDQVTINDSDSFDKVVNKFTLMGWFYLDSSIDTTSGSSDYVIPISKGTFTGSYFLVLEDSSAGYRMSTNVGGVRNFCFVPGDFRNFTNNWYHLTFTFDHEKGECRGYLNAELKDTRTVDVGNIDDKSNNLVFSQHVSGRRFPGKMDDIIIFSTNLDANEIQYIYERQKQKFAASYKSQILDLGTTQKFTSTVLKTEIPFMKELLKKNDSSSSYSLLTSDLSQGLIAYYTFDEESYDGTANEIKDSIGDHHGYKVSPSGSTTNPKGLLGNGFSELSTFRVVSSKAPEISNTFTIGFWIKVTGVPSNWPAIIQKGDASDFEQYLKLQLNNAEKTISLRLDVNGSGLQTLKSNNYIIDGKFHHVVFTSSGSNLYLYIDGKLDNQRSLVISAAGIDDPNSNMNFGSTHSDSPFFLDEFALWSRTFTANDVQELYRRGANRVKYQVRTCSDETCSDDPEWKGPGGDGTTYFSELYNRSSADITNMFSSCDGIGDDLCSDGEFSLTGSTKENAFEFNFIDSLINNYNALTARYFQYRILMEAEDNTACDGEPCLPSVSSISFETSNEYYDSSPSVTTVSPVNIVSTILRVEEEVSGGCSVKYQFSKDGSDFYYYDSKWIEASDSVSEANTASEISTKLRNFITSGELYMRAYLISDGSQACELRSFSVIQ